MRHKSSISASVVSFAMVVSGVSIWQAPAFAALVYAAPVAGNGVFGYAGDGGPAPSASFAEPRGLAMNSSGDLYVADYASSRVRKVSPSGAITTVAGTGDRGFGGDGGPATSARLSFPQAVAVDGSGNLYISDSGNNRIRRVGIDGTILTVAGTGDRGFGGDGGLATSARLADPIGVALDDSGNLFIADYGNHRVRKVSAAGVITTVAGHGDGSNGPSGDGGSATAARLANPTGVATDGSGNLFVAESATNTVRRVDSGGTIVTVAGTGAQGFSGDGGPAVRASLYGPFLLTVDALDNIYVADRNNHRVRQIAPDGTISTVAGNGAVAFTGPGPATATAIRDPIGLALDDDGDLYISDAAGNRVWKVGNAPPAPRDTTPPVVIAVRDRQPGATGWYNAPVTIRWTAMDDTDGVLVAPASVTVTADGANQVVTSAAVCDAAGNCATGRLSGLNLDATPPVVSIEGIVADSFTLGGWPLPAPTCSAVDSTSGVTSAGCTGGTVGGAPNGVGLYTYTAKAADVAGNVGIARGSWRVTYGWSGFLQPVNDTSHQVGVSTSIFKAGSTVPVKFQITTANGIVAEPNSAPFWTPPQRGGPVSSPVDEPVYFASPDEGETYRLAGDTWVYNWKTSTAMAGFYWRIGVRLDDGSTHFVNVGLW